MVVRVVAVVRARAVIGIVCSAAQHRRRKRVLRALLHNGHQRDQLLRLVPPDREDVRYLRAALCERAGLVERDDSQGARLLQMHTALDERAVARCVADGGDYGDGRGYDERAGAAHDEQYERAVEPWQERLAESRGDERHEHRGHEHRRRVVSGEGVNKSLTRRLLLLRLLYELDDARQRRVTREPSHLHLQVTPAVDSASEDVATRSLLYREALSGDGRLVHSG